ncbi:thiosulfate oxidation carrier protein SoxY [Poseidonibacter lekithochrous]|uniref:thiosulfate oxidation carrier protein SoxY n=1 Tax=Poseidonibacter lekithochrous TaxID=1904463 RepID=UPI0008FC7FD5|nr:thiosulfate oxidation carrier protein SoxY [Poseidonibacter lekithochrous]QKJ24112.1 sulfur oxidation protein SoxYZ, sulfur covalently binding protein [Poseidonibacter lekithochrous]
MNRRNFLGLGLGALAVSMAPSTLSAVNFRETKPKAWTATKVDEGMKEIFGTTSTTNGKVKLKAPDIAENGAVIPLTVSSKLAGSKVAIFQDANPEATVAVFTVPAGGIIDYSVRIKMAKTGTVTAVVEEGGKLYSASKLVKVTIGGCGG